MNQKQYLTAKRDSIKKCVDHHESMAIEFDYQLEGINDWKDTGLFNTYNEFLKEREFIVILTALNITQRDKMKEELAKVEEALKEHEE